MDPDKSVDPPSAPRRWRRRRYEALRIRKKICHKEGSETRNDDTKCAKQEALNEEKRDPPPQNKHNTFHEPVDKIKSSSLQNQQPESPESQISSQATVSHQQDSAFNWFGMETPQSQTTEGEQPAEYSEMRSLPGEKGQYKRLPLLPLDPTTTKPPVSTSTRTLHDLLEEQHVKDRPVKILLQPRESPSHAWQEYLRNHGTLDDPSVYDDPEVVLDILSSSTSSSSVINSNHLSSKSSPENKPRTGGVGVSEKRTEKNTPLSPKRSGGCEIDSTSNILGRMKLKSDIQSKINAFEHGFKVDTKVISSPSKPSSDLELEGEATDQNTSPSTVLTSPTSSLKTLESKSTMFRASKPATNSGTESRGLHQPSEVKETAGQQEKSPTAHNTTSSMKSLCLKAYGVHATSKTTNIDAALPSIYQVPWLRSSLRKDNEKYVDTIQQKETIHNKISLTLNSDCSKNSSSCPPVAFTSDNQVKGTKLIDNIPFLAPDAKIELKNDFSHDSDTLFDALDYDHQKSLSDLEQSSSKYHSSSIDDIDKNNSDLREAKDPSFDTETEQASTKCPSLQNEVVCVLSYLESEEGSSIFTSHSAMTSEFNNSTTSRHDLRPPLMSMSEATDVMLNLVSVQIFTNETHVDVENRDDQHVRSLSKEYEDELQKCKILIGQKETEIATLKRERDQFREDLWKKEQETLCGFSSFLRSINSLFFGSME